METKTYQELATAIIARSNCEKSGNTEWLQRHTDHIYSIVKDHAPSGAGIDNGTKIDLEKSNGDKLVFATSFHHMNDNGMYDGWTEHWVTVRPSLAFGIEISISGRNRNGIKEYIHDVFHTFLSEMYEEKVLTH